MWKNKKGSKQPYSTATVRHFNGGVTAIIPRDVLRHLGAEAEAQVIFKLRNKKTVSIKLFVPKKERLSKFKPLSNRNNFPPLSTFANQRS